MEKCIIRPNMLSSVHLPQFATQRLSQSWEPPRLKDFSKNPVSYYGLEDVGLYNGLGLTLGKTNQKK